MVELTKDKYAVPEIRAIWSNDASQGLMEEVWLWHISAMKGAGFKGADRIGTPPPAQRESGHEVVDTLNRFVGRTGFVNAHAGLTSSDVIDNVRLKQVSDSEVVILSAANSLHRAILEIATKYCNTVMIGYTHLQHATPVLASHRFGMWGEVLSDTIAAAPEVRAKSVGGATGDGDALSILVGRDGLHKIRSSSILGLRQWQEDPMQSSPVVDELRVAQWLSQLMAWCNKIGFDIRFLCSTGEIGIAKDPSYVGSSAMPRKSNPIEAEQVCSLSRLQPDYERAIWDCMAHNYMERTMDTSASMRKVLPEMFENAAYVLKSLRDTVSRIVVNTTRCKDVVDTGGASASTEVQLAIMIANGESRADAHRELNGKKHTP